MNQLLQEIAELEQKEAGLLNAETLDENALNVVRNQLSEKRWKLEQQQETTQREQKQQEHIDGLLQAVFDLGIFESIVDKPLEQDPNDRERIHEYEDRRKEFYLILYDFEKEQQQSLIDVHNEEIAQKDEKIRELIAAGVEKDNQLTEVRKHLNEALDRNAKLVEENNQFAERESKVAEEQENYEAKIRDLDGLLGQTQTLLNLANDKIGDLQSKLEAAQKPAEYTAPSQSLKERVESLKKKSPSQLDAALARWNLPPLDAPVIQEEVSQTGGTFPATQPTGDQVHSPEVAENVGESFREEQTDGLLMEGHAANDSVVAQEPVTIDQLNDRLKRVEAQLGIAS